MSIMVTGDHNQLAYPAQLFDQPLGLLLRRAIMHEISQNNESIRRRSRHNNCSSLSVMSDIPHNGTSRPAVRWLSSYPKWRSETTSHRSSS